MSIPNPTAGPTPATFVIRQPVDLIAIAPVVLGFRPAESVVLETFGGRDGPFHARADLAHDPDDQEALADQLTVAALRNDAAQAAVVVFSEDLAAARRQGAILCNSLCASGIDVIDVLCADGAEFHGIEPGAGAGTPYDLDSHPFMAQHVFGGALVHDSRSGLSDSLDGADEADRVAVAQAAADVDPDALGPDAVRAEALWMQGRIRRFRRTRGPLTPVDAGRMLALCGRNALRDVAWAELAREHGDAHVELWRDLVRRAPGRLRGRAAGLLAFAAWLHGDGALAWCAVERATAAAGARDDLAELTATALMEARPPGTWQRFCAEVLSGEAPFGDG